MYTLAGLLEINQIAWNAIRKRNFPTEYVMKINGNTAMLSAACKPVLQTWYRQFWKQTSNIYVFAWQAIDSYCQ